MTPHRRYRRKRASLNPRQRAGDYRIFVGAFPTGEFIDKIQDLRQQFDWKTSQITAPHVSLAGTYWRSGPATFENEHDLIARLDPLGSTLSRFDMYLGGIHTFGHRVIYLGVKPTEGLLTVRNKLIGVIGQDKHRRFRPHLTLAMRLKGPVFDQVLSQIRTSELSSERFATTINELHLMQRGLADPVWHSISTFPLLR